MKTLMRGICLVSLCFVATANSVAEAEDKPQKETYYVVRLSKWDRTISFQTATRAELAEIQKKLKYESVVIGPAYKAVSTEWSKVDASGKRGPLFPIRSAPPPRTVKVLGQFADMEKAQRALDRELATYDQAQKKLEKAAEEKKKTFSEAMKAKLVEKDKELADACAKLASKVDELASAEERKQTTTEDAGKAKTEE